MSTAATSVDLSSRWILPSGDDARKFNTESFEFSHRLGSHPLFQLPELLALAERTARTRPNDLYYDMGEMRPEQRWDEAPKRTQTPVDAMRQLMISNAWFLFRHAQRDPAYRAIFESGLTQIKEIAGPGIDTRIRRED